MDLAKHSRQYSFSVDTAEQIDLFRILTENRNATMLIVANAVFIKRSFLRQFSGQDQPEIMGECLHEDWGYSACQAAAEISLERICRFRINTTPRSDSDFGWHFRLIDKVNKDDLTSQIKDALRFKRLVMVNVTVIE